LLIGAISTFELIIFNFMVFGLTIRQKTEYPEDLGGLVMGKGVGER
jgi:hypothetical protein